MTINLSGQLRYDTRGLPEGYDPHKLYEYRRDTLVNEATGLESFLYKYIPWELIRSFAFAIDPTAPFKVAPGVITPVNRTRERGTASVLQRRYFQGARVVKAISHAPNYYVSNCWDPVPHDNGFVDSFKNETNSQPTLFNIIRDTTRRSRLVGSSQGELEMFKSYINSPPRSINAGDVRNDLILTHTDPPEPQCLLHNGINNPGTEGSDMWHYTCTPTGSLLSYPAFYERRSKEIDYCKALARNNCLSLLKDYSPFKRDYTLFRNIVELKDIPHSITSLRDTLGDLRKLFVSLGTQPKLRKSIFDLKANARNVPNEYLSYHFGWKQTWKDVNDLLALPERLVKKYNLLIKRNGQPTTFRTSRKFSSTEADIPGFGYEVSSQEHDAQIRSYVKRESEVRLVVNATFDFPIVNSPTMRWDHFADRIGAIPRVTDLYNLVPWTWLVDWFTGLGNYVEIIDNINHDPSLINWGLITAHTSGQLVTEYQSKSYQRSRVYIDYVLSEDSTTTIQNNHKSILHFECQTRNDVSQILDVKTTANPGSLSSYQQSILGALLAQRLENVRGKFRFTSL